MRRIEADRSTQDGNNVTEKVSGEQTHRHFETGRTEGGDKYKAEEDSKAKELVVAQPMGQLVKTLID